MNNFTTESTSTNVSIAPHSLEAEEALLGCIIGNEAALDDLTWLKPSDFFLVRHGWIYEAMLALHARQESIDNITLYEELERRNQIQDVGGHTYLLQLVNSPPFFLNHATYAAAVKSTSRQRQMLSVAGKIADRATAGDLDAVQALIAQANTLVTEYLGATNRLQPFLVHEKDLDKLPPVTWLIPGEIPERGFSVIYGPSGVGKSFFALEYALRLGQTMPIVYIAAEGEYGFPVRVAAWRKHNNLKPGHVHFFMNLVSLLDEKELWEFVDLIKSIKPCMIVVDTLAHCILPGNENDTRDMGFFVKAAKLMQKTFNCTVIVVHHTSKEGNHERGSVALRAASDTMIKLTGDDGLITVECSKSKDTQAFPTRYIKLMPVQLEDGTSSPVIMPAEKVIQTEVDNLTQNQQKILKALNHTIFKDGGSPADLVEFTVLGKGSVMRSLGEMLDLGFVRQEGRGQPYMITGEGKDKLRLGLGLESGLAEKQPTASPRGALNGASDDNRDSRTRTIPQKSENQPRESAESRESRESQLPILPSPSDAMPSKPRESGRESQHESQRESASLDPFNKRPDGTPCPTGPCPVCGALDRWELSKLTGRWHCRTCADNRLPNVQRVDPLAETQSG